VNTRVKRRLPPAEQGEVESAGDENPGDENGNQQSGDDRYVIGAGPLSNVEEMLPVRLEAALPSARHLVETESSDRAKQPDPRDDREEQGEKRAAHDRRCCHDTDEGVDQADEDQVAAHVHEIGPAFPQSGVGVGIGNRPDRDLAFGIRGCGCGCRRHEDLPSPRKGASRELRGARRLGRPQ
jgi:hypothetical protein